MFIFQPCLDFICQYVFCLFVIPCYLAFNFLKQVLILKILYTCTSLLILPIWIYGECSHVCTHIYTYAYSHCSLAEVCLVYRQWEKTTFYTLEKSFTQELSQGLFDWYCWHLWYTFLSTFLNNTDMPVQHSF